MLSSLITSKTRVKLLLKFFLNYEVVGYLRGLENELDESTNSIRLELNRLESDSLLVSYTEGARKFFKANTEHPFFDDIKSMVKKDVGIDHIVNKLVTCFSNLDSIHLVGSFAQGIPSAIIDIVLSVENIDVKKLDKKIRECEAQINKKIRYLILPKYQVKEVFKDRIICEVWGREKIRT